MAAPPAEPRAAAQGNNAPADDGSATRATRELSDAAPAEDVAEPSPASRDHVPAIHEHLEQGGPFRVRSLPLTALALIAVGVTLHYGRWVFLPIALAIFLQLLLAPIVSALTLRGRVPRPLAACALLLTLGLGLAYGFVRLAEPAEEWARQMPGAIEDLEDRFREVKRRVDEITRATESVEDAMDGSTERSPVVEMKQPSLAEELLSGARTTAVGGLVCLALLFFLLSSESGTLRKLVRVLPDLTQKKLAVETTREIQRQISTYLLTITLINLVLGILVGSWLALLGVPSPALWGAMAAILNYVPYLGSTAGVLVVAVVSIGQADTISAGLLAPAGYALLTMLEGMVITPLLLGRNLILSPVAILVWLGLWGWIWGVPGAVLAVPMLVAITILCDSVPPYDVIAEFLKR